MDRFSPWSFLREVLGRGAAIQRDYAAGNHKSYEAYAARLDSAARELAEQLVPHLAEHPTGGGDWPTVEFGKSLGLAETEVYGKSGYLALLTENGQRRVTFHTETVPWSATLGDPEDDDELWPWDVWTQQQVRDLLRAVTGRPS